jgi:hypothetical protein
LVSDESISSTFVPTGYNGKSKLSLPY